MVRASFWRDDLYNETTLLREGPTSEAPPPCGGPNVDRGARRRSYGQVWGRSAGFTSRTSNSRRAPKLTVPCRLRRKVMPSMPTYHVNKGSQFGFLDATLGGANFDAEYGVALGSLQGADPAAVLNAAASAHIAPNRLTQ